MVKSRSVGDIGKGGKVTIKTMASEGQNSDAANSSPMSQKLMPNAAAGIPRIPIPGPKAYNHEVETKGTDDWPPATVR